MTIEERIEQLSLIRERIVSLIEELKRNQKSNGKEVN